MRLLQALGLVLLSATLAAGEAGAQGRAEARLVVRLSEDSSRNGARAPLVRTENLLNDGRWLSALRSGLPLRLHYRIELWHSRGGWFDDYERQAEWDVVVRHEPLLDQYTVLTLSGGGRRERRYATLDALAAALGFSYRIAIRPEGTGPYYYSASVEISTLSDSDLDELERFLQGDLGGVPSGESFGDAVGRGARRLILRLAGLPRVRLEARSGEFTVR